MPPAYSDSEPESEHEEVIEPRNTGKGKGSAVYSQEPEDTDSIADEPVGDSAVEEGDDDGEEEYVVEKILGHSFEFPDKQLRYHTKWLGYDEKEDETWEPRENLSGAVDVLNAYHKSIGGPPTQHSDKASKKRPRQSNGRSSFASMEREESSESATKRLKAKPQKKIEGRGRKKNGTSSDGATVTPGDWKPPSPFPGSWDDLVLSIETIDCDSDGTKWAMVKWAEVNSLGSNRRSRSLLKTAHFACPQKMLTFYEQHLKFFERK